MYIVWTAPREELRNTGTNPLYLYDKALYTGGVWIHFDLRYELKDCVAHVLMKLPDPKKALAPEATVDGPAEEPKTPKVAVDPWEWDKLAGEVFDEVENLGIELKNTYQTERARTVNRARLVIHEARKKIRELLGDKPKGGEVRDGRV